MRLLALISAALAALVLGAPMAGAQTACTPLNQAALLALFSDAAGKSSITPANVRSLVCSLAGGPAATPTPSWTAGHLAAFGNSGPAGNTTGVYVVDGGAPLPIPLGLPAGWLNATANGLKCDGITDDTAALNSLIASMASGGNILFPAATCMFAGTISLGVGGVHLWCAGPTPNAGPNLLFTGSGTTNAINIGPQSDGGTQIYAPGVHHCTIMAPNRTGGYIFSVFGVSQPTIDNIVVYSGWQFLYARYYNTLIVDKINGWYNATSGNLLNAYAPVGAASDVLTLNDVVMNAQSKGANGMNFDGAIQTVRMNHVTVLNCGTGLETDNTQHATPNNVPQFFFIHDLEIDGCGVGASGSVSKYGVNFTAGTDFHIVDSDIDINMAKTSACTNCRPFTSSPDSSYSVTKNIYVESTHMHGSPEGAAYINARNVVFTDDNFDDLCGSGAGCDSAINVAAAAAGGVNLANIIYNGGGVESGGNPIYGVNINSGAGDVSIVGGNFRGMTTKSIINNSSHAIGFAGAVGYDGTAITATTCAATTAC